MSPNPQLEPPPQEGVKRSGRKVDEAFEEAARLAGSDLPPAEFFQKFLVQVLEGIDAPAGAVWLRTPQGFLQLQCQANIDNVGLDRHKGGRQSHNELLRQAFQMGKPMLLEPYQSSGIIEGLPGGNPTEYVCHIAPMMNEKDAVGLLEIWQEPRWDAKVQRTCLNYLVQMAGYASSYLKNQQGRKLVGQEQLWSQIEAFAREIHSSLDPTRVSYSVANEGRRLIGCDRLSVAVVYDRKAKIEAVSGADVVEKRSNLIMLMRALSDKVLKWGERLVYKGTKDEGLPPDVLTALDDYLAESNSKLLVLQPLRDDRQKDHKGPARSALVMECFEPPENIDALISRMEVVGRHACSAIYNATELKRIPLKWMWVPIVKVQDGLGGKTRAAIYGGTLAAAALVAAMVFVPYPLKLDSTGQLMPKERQRVYPTQEGIVKDFLVEPNAVFEPGHNLAELFNQELRAKLDVLNEEIQTAEKNAQNIAAQISLNKNPVEIVRLNGQREKELAAMRAKTRERDQLIKLNNGDPNRPGYFYVQAPKFSQHTATNHVPLWTVLDADFRERHRNQMAPPSEPLMRLGDKNGPWELEVKIPQKHIGQVLRAFPNGPDAKLMVDLKLTSSPTETFQGVLYRDKLAGEAVPDRDNHNETTPVVIGYVSLDDEAIPEDKRLPRDRLVTGVEVHAKVRCGNHPMGYSLFYGVWEFLHEKLFYFL